MRLLSKCLPTLLKANVREEREGKIKSCFVSFLFILKQNLVPE